MPSDITFLTDHRNEEVSLLDIVDHVLNTGIVLQGNLIISLAGVDLVYIGLEAVVTSVETARRLLDDEAGHSTAAVLPD